jgi:hypothetical protein
VDVGSHVIAERCAASTGSGRLTGCGCLLPVRAERAALAAPQPATQSRNLGAMAAAGCCITAPYAKIGHPRRLLGDAMKIVCHARPMAWTAFARGAALALLCWPLASAPPAKADGVLAVGITKDVAKDGFVIGYSVMKATLAEARDRAMGSCRNARVENAEAAKKECKVVAEFRDKCVAIADDPKNGTTGFGWAVAATRADAIAQALDMCKRASSSDRASFCRPAHASCDGTAK